MVADMRNTHAQAVLVCVTCFQQAARGALTERSLSFIHRPIRIAVRVADRKRVDEVYGCVSVLLLAHHRAGRDPPCLREAGATHDGW
eukprot:COSAG06_NODE_7657_length_2426_cov_3.248713_2_plen_87_part_00